MATGETSEGVPGVTIRGAGPEQRLFGRYTLKRVLGRGGMGIVWLAHDDELKRSVAMKFLPDMVVRDREAVEDLKRETRRSLDLTHHHIVRIYDFTQDENSAAIIMEYVDGETLSALKTQQPGGCFGISTLSLWAGHFCQGLDYAHRQARVVHRDLKPANLMVNSRGDLKITDFGISRSMSDSMTRVSMSNAAGTLAYMSPEQALGAPPAVADDIYAFGATLYDLLTGRPPFFRGNLQVQLETVTPPPLHVRRADLGNSGEPIPALWEEVIAACLAKSPQERPQSMGEIATLLGIGGPTTGYRPASTGYVPISVRTPASVPDAAATASAPQVEEAPPQEDREESFETLASTSPVVAEAPDEDRLSGATLAPTAEPAIENEPLTIPRRESAKPEAEAEADTLAEIAEVVPQPPAAAEVAGTENAIEPDATLAGEPQPPSPSPASVEVPKAFAPHVFTSAPPAAATPPVAPPPRKKSSAPALAVAGVAIVAIGAAVWLAMDRNGPKPIVNHEPEATPINTATPLAKPVATPDPVPVVPPVPQPTKEELARPYIDRAREQLKQRNFAEARREIAGALQQNPGDATATALKNDIDSTKLASDREAAQRLVEQGERLYPADLTEARSKAKQAIELVADYPGARALLAKIETRESEMKAADEAVARAKDCLQRKDPDAAEKAIVQVPQSLADRSDVVSLRKEIESMRRAAAIPRVVSTPKPTVKPTPKHTPKPTTPRPRTETEKPASIATPKPPPPPPPTTPPIKKAVPTPKVRTDFHLSSRGAGTAARLS